ncbi:MAG TPA: uL30 family ribosomal protein [Candidatus Nanoarchaeia archaeon]|nr:uL30 family ribosomal protein [Candidatus Nanoarchaeia archaeon]
MKTEKNQKMGTKTLKTERSVKKNKREISFKNTADDTQKVIIVLVRGLVNKSHPIKQTFELLKLSRKNQAVVIPKNGVNLGMIAKINDFVTWGEIDEATFKELVAKRGVEFLSRNTDSKNLYTYKSLSFNGKHYKPYFRLSPPTKGFGRKGIKAAFNTGGALGYRGDKINDLIKRML